MADNRSPQASISISFQSTCYLTGRRYTPDIDRRSQRTASTHADIAVELEGSEGQNDKLNIAELVMFGLEQSGAGMPFSLTQTSPNRWEAQASIKSPEGIDELKAVAKSDEGAEIGSVRLNIYSGGAGSTQSGSACATRIVTWNPELQLAILWRTETVHKAAIQGEANPAQLGRLGFQFARQFQGTGDLIDITVAISLLQKAIELSPPGHPIIPDFLSNLGVSFIFRFQHTRNISDASYAINAFQQAVDATPLDHENLPSKLKNLGDSFRDRFELTRDRADIASAVVAFQRAIDITPPGHSSLALFKALGSSLIESFNQTNDLADITNAVTALQKAVDLTSPDDPDLPDLLNILGGSLGARFKRKGDFPDITNAVTALQKAVDLTSPDDTDLPDRLNNLGGCLAHRFEYKGDLSDIRTAAETLQKAVDLNPPGSAANLPDRLDNLGNSLRLLFKRTGDLYDINRGIEAHEKAVKLTPPTRGELPDRLNNLGCSLFGRFEQTEDLSDVSKAIEVLQKAVQYAAPDHPRLLQYLDNFGNSYSKRFDRTGDLADIANAIAKHQKAVGLTPAGHPELPGRLSNLGNSLLARFELTDEPSDIENALAAHKRAVELTPPDHANQRALHHNLADVYSRFFDRQPENLRYIDNAISARNRAIELTPLDHPDLPLQLRALGISWRRRSAETHDSSALCNAIDVQQRAIQLTPPGHADLPYNLQALGNSLLQRFEQTKDLSNLSDVNEAIRLFQRSLELTPIGHPEHPHRLISLAKSFYELSTLTDMCANMDKCIAHFMSAATCSSPPSLTKLHASMSWAALSYAHHPGSPQTLAAFENSVGLLSMLAGLEQIIQYRHARLHYLSKVTPGAAASACAVGRSDKALEWVEHGRCLVWTQLSHLRTPLEQIRFEDKDLAQRILDVSKRLEKAGSRRPLIEASVTQKISEEEETCSQVMLAKEWECLLSKVRTTVPGCGNFLQPPTCSDIFQHLPSSGSVVVINVHRSRCDALALKAGHNEPIHIPLPKFSLKKADVYCYDLTDQLKRRGLRARGEGGETEAGVEGDGGDEVFREDSHEAEGAEEDAEEGIGFQDLEDELPQRALRPAPSGGSRRRYSVCEVLEGLWNDVVKPILDVLSISKFEESPGCAPPRIWWCPTGPLAFLPLHAAGVYGGSDPESVLDYVVSSYTPTVTSLTERVEKSLPIDGDTSGLFLVSQPNAKGLASIPGTTTEIRSVKQLAVDHGVNVLTLEGNAATVDAGLRYMKAYNSIHLACHATQNQDQPLQSCFFFHDGSLSLSTVIESNLTHADLAFLSACQTSTGEPTLSDEVVHLAAGMLAAGYRRVVATMWSIRDKDAPEVANDFYKYLLDRQPDGKGSSGNPGFDGSQAAYALHYSIQRLRGRLDDSQRSLLSWIPYVHFGL